MIPVGYMAKRIALRPDWLKTEHVDEILSVSRCVSEDFADWVNYWKHNGYWFFDSPSVIVSLAREHHFELSGVRWFYYETYDTEYDANEDAWRRFEPEESFLTSVESPGEMNLVGFDIVSFSCGNSAECSPLSCNSLAERFSVNRHCLLDSLENARRLIDDKAIIDDESCEPGPYRLFAIYEVPPPLETKTEQGGGGNSASLRASP